MVMLVELINAPLFDFAGATVILGVACIKVPIDDEALLLFTNERAFISSTLTLEWQLCEGIYPTDTDSLFGQCGVYVSMPSQFRKLILRIQNNQSLNNEQRLRER